MAKRASDTPMISGLRRAFKKAKKENRVHKDATFTHFMAALTGAVKEAQDNDGHNANELEEGVQLAGQDDG